MFRVGRLGPRRVSALRCRIRLIPLAGLWLFPSFFKHPPRPGRGLLIMYFDVSPSDLINISSSFFLYHFVSIIDKLNNRSPTGSSDRP